MGVGRGFINTKPMAINQDLKALVIDKERVDAYFFLYWYIHSGSLLAAKGGGSTVQGITLDDLRTFPILLPTKNEQTKIAEIISSIDSTIENNESLVNKLTGLKNALMQELFTKGIGHTEFKDSPLGKIPKDWKTLKLNDVLLEVYDCEHKTAPTDENGLFRIAGTSDVRNGELIYATMRRTSEAIYKEWTSRNEPKIGDIIFTREAPAGEAALIPEHTRVCLGQRTVLLRPNPEVILPSFLLYSFYSPVLRRKMELDFIGTTVSRINMADIKQLHCLVPPIDEQQKISDSVSIVGKRIIDQKDKGAVFEVLKKALMQDLLTGKVRVKTA